MKRRIVRLIALLPAVYVLLFLWHQHATVRYTLVDLGLAGRGKSEQAAQRITPPAQIVPDDRSAANSNRERASSPHLPVRFHCYTNAAGQVAWSEYRGFGAKLRLHAFLSSQGKTTDLGSLGGNVSMVDGFSNSGHVIGSSSIPTGGRRAFLWKDGVMQDLGTLPGGGDSYALALNDQDQVVGKAQTQTGEFHAFLWSEKEGMTDLGVLSKGGQSFADALNNKGQVVGWATTPNGAYHAVIWDHSKIEDLNRLVHRPGELVLDVARAINEQGQIRAEGSLHDQRRVFLLMP